ncbi:MAG: 2Fe-2S iron-sulfur cluster binding domain-containing protein [Chitinophagaceae bacterium]|nr:2Fe-2S iron-sulfur cluster binding domain-containing protein [Chitinophagaceae bacterium]
MYTLKINFEQKDTPAITLENVAGGQSVLEVLLDNNIELHHNCGMVCACSTCHIYINQGEDIFPEIIDREEDFIDRARNPRINSRLGCQCVLDKDQAGTISVTLPDQTLIYGD